MVRTPLAVFRLLCLFTFTNSQLISTTSGTLQGTTLQGVNGQDYRVFLGIPYARALRFQKPQPSNWTGILNATRYGSVCAQYQNAEAATYGMSEDCLLLNVLTPPDASENKLFPVLFWIHGGSLRTGSTAQISANAIVNNLVSKGIVVVTIQYRLAILGKLETYPRRAAGFFTTLTKEFPPNLGTHDQIFALEWVRTNIRKFGGDPERITLGGQSAGACSVSAITMSPKVPACYFRGVIQLSATAEVCWDGSFGSLKNSELRAKILCNVTLTQPADEQTAATLKNCLQNMDYKDFSPPEKTNFYGWNIVVDGDLFPNVPGELLKTAPRRPTLLGVVSDEWSNFELYRLTSLLNKTVLQETRDDVMQFMNTSLAFFGTNKSTVIDRILQEYAEPILEEQGEQPGTWFRIATDVFSDAAFASRVTKEAQRLVDGGNENVFLYEFTDSSKSLVRQNDYNPVGHSDDLQFLFADPSSSGSTNTMQDEENANVTNEYASIIANFVKSLRPMDFSVALDTSVWQYFEIGADSLGWQADFKPMARRFWDQELAPYGEFPQPLNETEVATRKAVAAYYADQIQRTCSLPSRWRRHLKP